MLPCLLAALYLGFSKSVPNEKQLVLSKILGDVSAIVIRKPRSSKIPDMAAYNGPRTLGKRLPVAAILLTLFLTLYLLRGPSHLISIPRSGFQQDHPGPLREDEAHGDIHHEYEPQPKAIETAQSTSSSQSSRPICSITKVSMLYGDHKFNQLEAALKSHRTHCERWGCDFKTLDRDLSDRKLYSKHYFLLSTLLHELSKPEGERQSWLL